jgi:hypothetical protein
MVGYRDLIAGAAIDQSGATSETAMQDIAITISNNSIGPIVYAPKTEKAHQNSRSNKERLTQSCCDSNFHAVLSFPVSGSGP